MQEWDQHQGIERKEMEEGGASTHATQLEGIVSSSFPSNQKSFISLLNTIPRPGPSGPFSLEKLHVESMFDVLDSIITTIPDIHLNHLLVGSNVSSSLDEEGAEKPPYNLRSRDKKHMPLNMVGVLRPQPLPVGPKNLRGQKSNLSKA